DGTRIAFVMLVPDSTVWRISLPEPPAGAKWTPAPRVVDRLHYRQDRVGYVQQGFTHLFVVPAGGGTARPLTSGRWNVGARFDGLALGAGFDWTPNGTAIVFDGLADTTWDAQYRSSRLYVVDATSGAVRPLVSRPGAWSDPVVSPDGRRLGDRGGRDGDARSVARAGPRPRAPRLGAGRQGGVLHGAGSRRGQRVLRRRGGRRAGRDPGPPGVRPRLGGAQLHRRGGAERPVAPRRRRAARPATPGGGAAAHRRERRRPREQAPRRGRRGVVRLERRGARPGLGGQAARLRPRAPLPAGAEHSRRPVRDVRRRLQLRLPELRRQRLPGVVHQPPRLDRLRRRLRRRDRARLPG